MVLFEIKYPKEPICSLILYTYSYNVFARKGFSLNGSQVLLVVMFVKYTYIVSSEFLLV